MLNQIMSFQAALNLFGFGLAVDGKPGPMTRDAARVAAANLPHIKDIPADVLKPTGAATERRLMGGRASHFGGPQDTADYCEGQAFLPHASRRTPAQYYAWVPEDVRAYLRPEMAEAKAWPMLTDWQGKRRPAGVSYYLDPNALYVALRLYGDLAARGRAGEPIMVRVMRRDDRSRSVIARVTDWGPSVTLNGKRVWADVDVSPGVYAALGLSFGGGGDHVWIEVLNEVQK